MTKTDEKYPCGECGMLCQPTEYHPYAACLMFRACHDSRKVRANLHGIFNDGLLEAVDAIQKHNGGVAKPIIIAAIKRRMRTP